MSHTLSSYIFMRNWYCPNCLHLHAIWNNIRSLAAKLHNKSGINIVQIAHIFMQIWTFVVRRTFSCGIIIAQIAHIFMQFETIFDCWPQSSTIKAALTKTRLASSRKSSATLGTGPAIHLGANASVANLQGDNRRRNELNSLIRGQLTLAKSLDDYDREERSA